MKKIYTLLLAAAVGVSAASAQAPMKKNLPLRAQAMELTQATQAQAVEAASHKMAKLPAKADAKVADIAGTYYLFGKLLTGQNSGLDVNIAASGDAYTMEFPDLESNKINCAFGDVTFTQAGQTIVIPCLSIPTGQVLFTQDGVDYKIYLTGLEDGKPTAFKDETIYFVYEDGIFYPLYEDTGLGWLNSKYSGNGFVSGVTMFPLNANMFTNVSDYSGATDKEFPMFVGQNGSEISMIGFGGILSKLNLTYDPAQEVVYGQKQILDSWVGEDNKEHQLLLCTVDGGQLYAVVVFGVEEENGKTYLTYPDKIYAYCNDEDEEYAGTYYIYQNTEIELNWLMSEAYTAGVNDIISSEAVDTDAPVEYYNLQGVRVTEPAAGLYIKRQGKTVTKVVIR